MSATTRTKPQQNINVHLILTGASGYLGQHLLSHWIRHGISSDVGESSNVKIRITALYHKSEGFPEAVKEFQKKQQHSRNKNISDVVVKSIDLANPEDSSMRSIVGNGKDDDKDEIVIVVHSAALSSPRICQENPEAARAINVPTKFLNAVLAAAKSTYIIALSTDQVYDGEAGSYKEDEKDGLKPKNVYGQTKLELEEYLLIQQQKQQSSSLFAALRSSIIMGPKAPIHPECAHGTFLDFCKSIGQEGGTFYTNEYRCVIRADKVIATIGGLISKILDDDPSSLSSLPAVYNMGGPVRVNRLEMAKAVFQKFGYDTTLLVAAEQQSPTSPLDISMDSSLLLKERILKEKDDHDDPDTYLKSLVDYVFEY